MKYFVILFLFPVISLLGQGRPLYVINGVPKPGNDSILLIVNPKNIFSIEVMTDANAYKTYGVLGKYGAIRILTMDSRVNKVWGRWLWPFKKVLTRYSGKTYRRNRRVYKRLKREHETKNRNNI